mgnify:CR=1 FL=1
MSHKMVDFLRVVRDFLRVVRSRPLDQSFKRPEQILVVTGELERRR